MRTLPDNLILKHGEHNEGKNFCVMEAAAWVAEEEWTDHPECVCPVIAAFLRSWNDSLQSDDDRTRLLKPLIPRVIGTRNKTLETKRSWMAVDWLIRECTTAWIELLPECKNEAESLRCSPEITDIPSLNAVMPVLESARSKGDAAWDAARTAAWDEAWAAAWDEAWAAARAAVRAEVSIAAWAAVWNAAWNAAWAAARAKVSMAAWAAAWSAALSAARSAALSAVGDVVWDATLSTALSAARDALSITVAKLQQSAIDLVLKMCEMKNEN